MSLDINFFGEWNPSPPKNKQKINDENTILRNRTNNARPVKASSNYSLDYNNLSLSLKQLINRHSLDEVTNILLNSRRDSKPIELLVDAETQNVALKIFEISKFANLNALTFDHHSLNDENLFFILQKSTVLNSLSLGFCHNITDEGPFNLPRTVTKIKLLGMNVSDKFLEAIVSSSNLTRITLDQCPHITLAGCQILSPLQKLKVISCPISDESIKVISKVRTLEILKLIKCRQIWPVGFHNLRKLRNLRVLDLSYADIFGPTACEILKKVNDLEVLRFSSCDYITEHVFEDMHIPATCKQLDFSYTSISDVALWQIMDNALNLEHIDLSGCSKLTYKGFSRASFPPTLKSFTAYHTKIDDEGIKHLLEKCDKLIQVKIQSYNPIAYADELQDADESTIHYMRRELLLYPIPHVRDVSGEYLQFVMDVHQ